MGIIRTAKRHITKLVVLGVATGTVTVAGLVNAAVDAPARVVQVVDTTGAATTATQAARVARAKRLISTITVKGRAAKTGYSRAQFGDGWDTVRGCDMRNRVLARDLTGETKKTDHCTVIKGTYRREPYTGKKMTFVRASTYAHALDIDHRYPLSLAWQQGAWRWTAAKRERFANDGVNLVASNPSANRQKGDSGPAAWLPVKASRCDYVAAFTVVAAKYSLSMNKPDHDTVERTLASC